jgi:hypothetical protein
MQAGENFKPSDFGQVLVAGTGEPSEALKAEMAIAHHMLDFPIRPKNFASRFKRPAWAAQAAEESSEENEESAEEE